MRRVNDGGTRHPEVMTAIRQLGLAFRDQIAETTQLSTTTIARAVAELLAAGVIRERPDRARTGAVGRPSIPVSLDDTAYVVCGVHLGRQVVTVCVASLDGSVLGTSTLRADQRDSASLVSELSQRVRSMLERLPRRQPLALGIVAPWRDVDFPVEEFVEKLASETSLPVEAADHIQAIANAEFAHGRRDRSGVTLYLYARDRVGFSVIWDGQSMQHDVTRVGRLAHLPTGSKHACECGQTGCLEATASDQMLARRAYEEGLIVHPDIGAVIQRARRGSARAHRLLVERAEVLGRSAAVVRDMLNPDQVILAGQAFTGYETALDDVVAGFTRTTTLPRIELTFTRFGAGVQAIAAATTALRAVDRDPLEYVRRAQYSMRLGLLSG